MLRLFLSYLFISACLFSKANTKVNYDSVLTVIETSENRSDFVVADSILDLSISEYGAATQKRLIFTASQRTKELGFEFLYGKFIFRESIVNTLQGDIGLAMQQAEKALQIFSKYRSLDAARCYNTMGSMTAGQGDIPKALNYLNRAVEIGQQFENEKKTKLLQCDNHLVLGYIYILAEEYDSSRFHLNQALTIAKTIDYRTSQNYVFLNFADVNRRQGRYKEAFIAAKKAIEISTENQYDNLLCVGYTRIGEIYYAMENNDSALYYYQIAEEIGIKQNLSRRLLKIYQTISSIYIDQGDYKSASNYQTRRSDLYEEVQAREKEARLEMAQTKFEVVEKINQINSLAEQKEHEQERNKLLTIAIIITIAAFILLAGTVTLIFNRLRLNRKIQHERHEKELSIYQMTAMKTQMNPHFTFNALTSIQDLILREKKQESHSYISKFADLMRKTLNHSDKDFIEIEDEFDAIRLYLELEALRFQGDLDIKFETNGIGDLMIPPLLIQPFIENAIKHGLFHKKDAKHLLIEFRMDTLLTCTITDDGIGRKASAEIQKRRSNSRQSFAVKSIESRFEILRNIYKEDVGVKYTDLMSGSESKGTTVVISLPFKRT